MTFLYNFTDCLRKLFIVIWLSTETWRLMQNLTKTFSTCRRQKKGHLGDELDLFNLRHYCFCAPWNYGAFQQIWRNFKICSLKRFQPPLTLMHFTGNKLTKSRQMLVSIIHRYYWYIIIIVVVIITSGHLLLRISLNLLVFISCDG